MKNKYFGLVCIIFSCLIAYMYYSKLIGHFLIPSMQKYLLICSPILLAIGILLITSKEKGRITVFDLLLLIPVVMIIISGDGKLDTFLVNNRSNSFSKTREVKVLKDDKNKDEEKKDILKEVETITHIDYEVEDVSYAGLSDAITYNQNPQRFVGKTIRVRGFILKDSEFLPKGTIGIGKYLISCCAADAGFVGFIATSEDITSMKNNKWYEIEGVLELGKDVYNQSILQIKIVNYKEISSTGEEYYVYPCYSYGDGSCKEVTKYHLN